MFFLLSFLGISFFFAYFAGEFQKLKGKPNE